MSTNKEIERTYLAKSIPDDLKNSKSTKLTDYYFPASETHAKLRIRRYDNRYELTKKTVLNEENLGIQQEENINLTAAEFEALAKGDGRKLAKTRYYYNYGGHIAEIDIFDSPLQGLVLIDIEFKSEAEMHSFKIPDFCLTDVAQEDFIAGGVLAGKSYDQVAHYLNKFKYQRLFLKP